MRIHTHIDDDFQIRSTFSAASEEQESGNNTEIENDENEGNTAL